jgi:hypothetical protein
MTTGLDINNIALHINVQQTFFPRYMNKDKEIVTEAARHIHVMKIPSLQIWQETQNIFAAIAHCSVAQFIMYDITYLHASRISAHCKQYGRSGYGIMLQDGSSRVRDTMR